MIFNIFILIFFLTSCSPNYTKLDNRKHYNYTGFAYIYNPEEFKKDGINKNLNNELLQISHQELKVGSLIKLINPKTKESLVLKNINHYRDFISMEDISKIIFVLMKKKYKGILNLGSGRGILLKDIALVIAKKYRKKIIFLDNKKITYLVASINKLLKNYKLKKPKKIENLIF